MYRGGEQSFAKPYPLVKWVGGKRQLLPTILKFIPQTFGRYFEPFVGGGALFFELSLPKTYISDKNEELINLYKVVRDFPSELISSLKKHENSKDYFLKIRGLDRSSSYLSISEIERASRFIYLNRTCFNGMYRVNSSGFFNVPFGNYKNPRIVDAENIFNASYLLKETDIRCADFSEVLRHVKSGDFVYFDPPYVPLNETSAFTYYTKNGFDLNLQIKLRDLCDKLNSKGIKFLLSNSNTDIVKDLYKSYEKIEVFASRNINANPNGRGKIVELLIRNYK